MRRHTMTSDYLTSNRTRTSIRKTIFVYENTLPLDGDNAEVDRVIHENSILCLSTIIQSSHIYIYIYDVSKCKQNRLPIKRERAMYLEIINTNVVKGVRSISEFCT